MDGWMDKQTKEWIYELMNRCMDGWIDRWIDRGLGRLSTTM